MTAARQERKRAAGQRCLFAIALIAGGIVLGPTARTGASTTERVVVDFHTGLAISGFDPVAYFVDSRPSAGREDFELKAAGAVWRFRNEGNRAAFAAAPDVYMPRFGGYDPTAVARGASAPGHPEVWLVSGKRLYLFFSTSARDAFAADPDRVIEAAEQRWPQVQRTLTP